MLRAMDYKYFIPTGLRPFFSSYFVITHHSNTLREHCPDVSYIWMLAEDRWPEELRKRGEALRDVFKPRGTGRGQ